MKKAILFLLASLFFCGCSEKKETIDFVTLTESEFNAKPLAVPYGKVADSSRHVHDSCMGFAMDVNAFFTRETNSFFVGSIVNRQSLKVINSIDKLGLSQAQLVSGFNIITNPCYEKRVLHFPLKSLLGKDFILQFPNAGDALNKEINDAISASGDAEMQTGAWMYLDMKAALKQILDTTHSPAGLHYKKNLLDTSNMVLIAAESVTNISFIISTGKDMSEALQVFLKTKPSLPQSNSQSSLQLFYIDNNKLEITLNGLFPVAGEFVKAELK